MKLQSKTFLKATAICSFLGALTTIILIFLPNPEAPDFETRVLLHNNNLYLTKLWVLFIHPQVNIFASFGIAYLLFKKYPLQIVFGTFFLLLWAYSEMSQQALLIDALNQLWRPGYIKADDEITRSMFKTLINTANGLSDSKYFLVIYGFGSGTLLYGLAFIRENRLGKWIGFFFIFIGILSLSSFLRYYLSVNWLNGIVNWSYEWIYSYLQPLVRIALGIWIFRSIKTFQEYT